MAQGRSSNVRYIVRPFSPGRVSAVAISSPRQTCIETFATAHTSVKKDTRATPGVTKIVAKFASPTQL